MSYIWIRCFNFHIITKKTKKQINRLKYLANLTNNASSLETLNHELGHCIYTLGTVKSLPFFDRDQYPAMTEAIAMMMQDLQKRENILKNLLPQEILEQFDLLPITKAIKYINIPDEIEQTLKAVKRIILYVNL